MIYYLLLLLMPLTGCCQNISQKQYTLKTKSPNILLFSSITSFMALLYFAITSGFNLTFVAKLIPYALGYGVCYAAAWVGTIFALHWGSMAMTNLIVSFCITFPIVYGIMIGETLTPMVVIGMLLLIASFACVNMKSGPKSKFSPKWLICVLIALLGNGFCSILQNLLKRNLGEVYTHEFMIIALFSAAVMLFIASMFTSKNIAADLKSCLPYASANGIVNGIGNMILLTVIGNIPNTILYPTNSALGMIGIFLLSFFMYKERFTKKEYAGYALGMLSLILLNI